jgi:hypothetical protein
VQRIRDELCAGVLDLVVGAQLGKRTLHSIELFGAKVLPRMRDGTQHVPATPGR